MAQVQSLLKPIHPILNWGNSLTKGLVFDAPLWEGAGLGKTKELVTNLDGTIVASGATWSKYHYGTALDFSAAASSVSYIPPAAVNSLLTVSVEALVYPRSNGGSNVGRIIHKNSTNGDAYWQTNMDSVRGLVWVASTSGTHPIWKVTALTTNVWSHVIWTWDGVIADSPAFYLNGAVQTVTVDTVGSGTRSADTANLYIGNRADGLRNWDGKIAYVRVWNRILTATEARSLYTNPWQIYVRSNYTPFYVPSPAVGATVYQPTWMMLGMGM